MERPEEGPGGSGGAPLAALAAAYRVDRVIALALPMGVLSFWGISLATQQGRAATSVFGLDAGLATNLALGLQLAAVIVAFVMRGRAVSGMEDARRAAAPDAARLMARRSLLITAWALLEAPALLAGVAHFASGQERVLMYVAPVYLAGVAFTFPRAEWYGADARR